MSDHDYMRLRVITVSTRAGLATHLGEDEAAALKVRADDLLANLERDVLANGADVELLRRIAEARLALTG